MNVINMNDITMWAGELRGIEDKIKEGTAKRPETLAQYAMQHELHLNPAAAKSVVEAAFPEPSMRASKSTALLCLVNAPLVAKARDMAGKVRAAYVKAQRSCSSETELVYSVLRKAENGKLPPATTFMPVDPTREQEIEAARKRLNTLLKGFVELQLELRKADDGSWAIVDVRPAAEVAPAAHVEHVEHVEAKTELEAMLERMLEAKLAALMKK